MARLGILVAALGCPFGVAFGQTLHVPGGSVGNISGSNVGIGTSAPAYNLEVIGDVRASGNLVEEMVVFTPTAVGWYRIVSAAGQSGGTIRTEGAYDGGTTALEFTFSIRGWGQRGTVTLLKNTGVNGNIIDKVRISTNGGGNVYLDVYVTTATSPSAITIFGYGPGFSGMVASPTMGATAGSTDVRVLPVGYGYGAYDDFRTTGNIVTYTNDGTSAQGYIYHGPAGQAAFGNGVTNGETWITRTGGAGSIKLGEYDFGAAYLTVASGTGYVGVGTNAPTARLAAARDGAVVADYALAQLHLTGASNTNQRLAIGYDTTNDLGLVQAYVNGGAVKPLVLQSAGGNVGIGTTNPTQKLSVNGTVRAKEVIIEASPWPDDVFAPGYALPTVEEVAAHIDANGHLPGVPSASAVAEEGVALGEMQKTLLRKVEELTLYVIAQQDELKSARAQIARQGEQIEALRAVVADERDPR